MEIFTLLDDKVAEFDRLAEQTAEQVRIGEPDTLVYVIHSVPGAPLQRIFYEIYRNRAAFDAHESRPYTQRFVAERRAYVLATNIIELRLKYAKVAPLTPPAGPPQQAASPVRPMPAPQQAAPSVRPMPAPPQASPLSPPAPPAPPAAAPAPLAPPAPPAPRQQPPRWVGQRVDGVRPVPS